MIFMCDEKTYPHDDGTWDFELDTTDKQTLLNQFNDYSASDRLQDIERIAIRSFLRSNSVADATIDPSLLHSHAKKICDAYMKNCLSQNPGYVEWILKCFYDRDAEVENAFSRIRRLLPMPWLCEDLIFHIQDKLDLADAASFLQVNKDHQKYRYMQFHHVGYRGKSLPEGIKHLNEIFSALIDIKGGGHLPKTCINHYYFNLNKIANLPVADFFKLFDY
jgi:hypothetical protein